MSATVYADTSLLASLYLADANTPAPRAAVAAALLLQARRFLPLDTRELALARAAGLRTA